MSAGDGEKKNKRKEKEQSAAEIRASHMFKGCTMNKNQ